MNHSAELKLLQHELKMLRIEKNNKLREIYEIDDQIIKKSILIVDIENKMTENNYD